MPTGKQCDSVACRPTHGDHSGPLGSAAGAWETHVPNGPQCPQSIGRDGTETVRLLRYCRRSGMALTAQGDRIVWEAIDPPPPELLAALSRHKHTLSRILRGDYCRHCGEPIAWRTDGTCFADGSSAHIACHRASEAERHEARSPDDFGKSGGA